MSVWTRIYGIYDLKAEQLLGNTFHGPNDDWARRTFNDIVVGSPQGNVLREHIDDFNLICLGEFNAITGQIHQKTSEAHSPFEDPINLVITGKTLRELATANANGEPPQ